MEYCRITPITAGGSAAIHHQDGAHDHRDDSGSHHGPRVARQARFLRTRAGPENTRMLYGKVGTVDFQKVIEKRIDATVLILALLVA
ncbi:hypothetical protein [Streptomyces sp. NPDC087859]|uniref:hypothetical protein n=1 Tax=Streptomyces sp. NPDC087859 TaxID=3365812 RepID=UPI003805F574